MVYSVELGLSIIFWRFCEIFHMFIILFRLVNFTSKSSSTFTRNDTVYMKVVENNRYIWLHLSFLRYLTGGSGMISGSFFWRPFIKILIFRFTISLFMFLHHGKFPRNFAETYGKSQNFFQNFFGILSTSPLHLFTHPITHPNPHFTPYTLPPLKLQTCFSR